MAPVRYIKFIFLFRKMTLQIVSCFMRSSDVLNCKFTKEFVYLFVYFWKLLEPFGKKREKITYKRDFIKRHWPHCAMSSKVWQYNDTVLPYIKFSNFPFVGIVCSYEAIYIHRYAYWHNTLKVQHIRSTKTN